jgi:hypothetical protein
MKSAGSYRAASQTRAASALHATLACGALTAAALASTIQPAFADTYKNGYAFRDVVNTNDATFNQELGINVFGKIAGYFGSGAGGHPNKGYTVTPPYTAQNDFTNENFPGSVQTQVTGLNNKLKPTTVGFWSDTNNVSMVNNNFGFVNFGGQNGTFIEVNHPGTGTINGVMTNQLLGVNVFNVAVGFYVDTAGATHGYTYNIARNTYSGNIDDPNGVGATTAAAINDLGQLAGFFTDGNGVTHGFIESGGYFRTVDAPGAVATSLLGLSNSGEAVGFDVDAAMQMHGVICNFFQAKCQLLDDPNGIGTTTFNGVNSFGQIVGFYVNGAGNTIGLVAAPIW